MVGVSDKLDSRAADLFEVKGAYGARHADGYTGVIIDEHARESDRQKSRLFHGAVVVIDKIDGVLVDILEKLGTYGVELRLGISRSRPHHIARIRLTEVTL